MNTPQEIRSAFVMSRMMKVPLLRFLKDSAIRISEEEYVKKLGLKRSFAPALKTSTGEDLDEYNKQFVKLPLPTHHAQKVRAGDILVAEGVDGYSRDGDARTPGIPLMLMVTTADGSHYPEVKAINGRKSQREDEWCSVPAIPVDTKFYLFQHVHGLPQSEKEIPEWLLYKMSRRDEEESEIDIHYSAMAVPAITGDLTDSSIRKYENQAARDYMKQYLAETESFLWSQPGARGFGVGLKYQFARSLHYEKALTASDVLAILNVYFSNADSPRRGVWFAGSALMMNIQMALSDCRDIIRVTYKTNRYGEAECVINTAWGAVTLLHEPAFDLMSWTSQGAIINPDSCYLYQKYEETEGVGNFVDMPLLEDGSGLWVTSSQWKVEGADKIWLGYAETIEKMSPGDMFVVVDAINLSGKMWYPGEIGLAIKTMADDGSESTDYVHADPSYYELW